jgi:hypothetical protein
MRVSTTMRRPVRGVCLSFNIDRVAAAAGDNP